MEMRIPKVCIPPKTNRPCDDFKIPQICIPTPGGAAGDSGTVSDVYYSCMPSTSAGSSSTGRADGLNEWPGPNGEDVPARCEDDGMSDEDYEGTYAVVIDDTLSTDSSSPVPRCDDVKSEDVANWGDAIPYQPFSITQTMVNVTGGMSTHGDIPYDSLSRSLSPTPSSTLHDAQHTAIQTSGFENIHKTVKQEPAEGDGQFTYSMSSLELEGQLVNQAIDNLMTLPQVFTEVVESKKSQSAEIQHQQLQLVTLQKEYEEAMKENQALRDDISSVTHNIGHTRQSVVEGTKQCDTLQQDVVNYVSICEDIQQAVCYKQEEYDLHISKIESYQLKIADYIRTVAKQENQSDTRIQLLQYDENVKRLRNTKKEIESNQEEFVNVMDGTSEKQVTDKLTYLKEELEKQTTAVEDKTKLTDDLRDQQRLLEQSILVLHKRNAAQLTRLRRQLKEVQIRKRRWNDQISQLESVVADLKQQLQE